MAFLYEQALQTVCNFLPATGYMKKTVLTALFQILEYSTLIILPGNFIKARFLLIWLKIEGFMVSGYRKHKILLIYELD
jgi:hypothetical protein